MVSTALTLENTTSENKLSPIPFSTRLSEPQKTNILNDHISLLFPKCRPKNDINLNQLSSTTTTTTKPTTLNSRAGVSQINKMQSTAISPPTSSLSSESSLTSKSPNVGTNPFLTGPDLATNYSLGGNYFNSQMRDSNIDGVSKYSQKRSKHSNYYYNHPPQQQQQQFNHQRENDSNIWELRNRTPVNTVLNSPDLIEMETKLTYTKQPYNHIRVGRSPVSHPEPPSIEEQTNLTTDVYDDGVVVFDDIEEDWNNSGIQYSDGAESKLYEENRENEKKYLSLLKKNQNEDNSIEVSKLDLLPNKNISGIMEYDGSPRRFGQIQTTEQQLYVSSNSKEKLTTLHPPRPGFPQRIVPTTSEQMTTSPLKENKFNSEDNSNDISEMCNSSIFTMNDSKTSTFDYLYEFSETRKVLEEFFKCPAGEEDKTLEKYGDFNGSDVDSLDIHYEFRGQVENKLDSYIGQKLASSPQEECTSCISPNQNGFSIENTDALEHHDFDLFLDSASHSSGEIVDNDGNLNGSRKQSKHFGYSPETTDYDSNCGDLDSEVSLRLIGSEFGLSGEFNCASTYTGYSKFYTSMPVLEDGLSSGHASDTENNNQSIPIIMESIAINENDARQIDSPVHNITENIYINQQESPVKRKTTPVELIRPRDDNNINNKIFQNTDPDLESLYSIHMVQLTPPPPAPAPHRSFLDNNSTDVQAALKDIRATLQRTKTLTPSSTQQTDKIIIEENMKTSISNSPIWVPRYRENSESLDSENQSKNISADEEEADTDLETDRLLGHQRSDEQVFYDEKSERKTRSILSSSLSKLSPQIIPKKSSGHLLRHGLNSILPTTPEIFTPTKNNLNLIDICEPGSSPEHEKTPEELNSPQKMEGSPTGSNQSKSDGEKKKKNKSKEVLIEGVLFRAKYLGSTQLVCEGQPTKSTRMMQAEEAVSRIKSPEGESQPSTEVDLFISTEKIMVLNTDLKEIMMDHALRTISYIADIGDLVVLMARRRFVPQEMNEVTKPNRTPKMICHVFESEEAQFIAQSIGQAFQVAYMEFLKANGIEDHSFVKEMDYQEVLNSQEIFGDELEIFAKKELQKEVVVPKAKGEILGVVIVESGWGSMLPTVVIANLLSTGAAARCGQLNIGDQIIAVNGLSLVGLPLSTCQNYIKNAKTQTVVKFTVVPCAPVVEVKIKRPNTKYQLGFSVQNGVICSLLRGGIAERGGVRVGHRIIEINNQSVVAVPHEKIVNLLATSVGEILMKTMPTSMFRLLTGQENPIYI